MSLLGGIEDDNAGIGLLIVVVRQRYKPLLSCLQAQGKEGKDVGEEGSREAATLPSYPINCPLISIL